MDRNTAQTERGDLPTRDTKLHYFKFSEVENLILQSDLQERSNFRAE
jgi:hypothetical protein